MGTTGLLVGWAAMGPSPLSAARRLGHGVNGPISTRSEECDEFREKDRIPTPIKEARALIDHP